MNKVVLVGRLTKDPELKHTATDIPVVQFTIAVNRTYASKNGEKQADFINCVVWRNQAENLVKYMKKGSLIGVDGRIETRTFDDQSGMKRYITEVICESIHFLESKSSRSDSSYSGYGDINQYNIPAQQKKEVPSNADPFEDLQSEFDISNDDLPF